MYFREPNAIFTTLSADWLSRRGELVWRTSRVSITYCALGINYIALKRQLYLHFFWGPISNRTFTIPKEINLSISTMLLTHNFLAKFINFAWITVLFSYFILLRIIFAPTYLNISRHYGLILSTQDIFIRYLTHSCNNSEELFRFAIIFNIRGTNRWANPWKSSLLLVISNS